MIGPHMDAIIDLLQKNALMPRDEMARLLNMTTAEVEAAIAKLEADGIILGYQP
ncbi:MAG: winged helix-turn-helix transcriptional regulator, partial [Spartobacteria bacterium]